MGLIKWICKRFKCTSNCMINGEIPDDIQNIDLSKYILKPDDIKLLMKIQTKRPSVHNYKHIENRTRVAKI